MVFFLKQLLCYQPITSTVSCRRRGSWFSFSNNFLVINRLRRQYRVVVTVHGFLSQMNNFLVTNRLRRRRRVVVAVHSFLSQMNSFVTYGSEVMFCKMNRQSVTQTKRSSKLRETRGDFKL